MQNASLAKSVKLVLIIHLFFCFIYLSYLLLKPILNDWLASKARTELIESVLQEKDLFLKLDSLQQEEINQELIKNEKNTYFATLSHLIQKESSFFALSWLFCSFFLSISILFFHASTRLTCWILPLLVVGYGIQLSVKDPPPLKKSLYPNKEEILQFSPHNEGSKKEVLQRAWAFYLIRHWAQEEPSPAPDTFKEQLRKGIFTFNLARTNRIIHGQETISMESYFRSRPSFFLWFFYLAWNAIFAYFISKKYGNVQVTV